MALRLASTNESPRPMSRFLMTPAQHREQARLLRKAGNEVQAVQHDMLAAAIERREQGGQESEPA
jgi:hypothetical protein